MEVGDSFVRHTAYCFQVLEGVRKEEFNERGVWPSSEPATVDEPSQETLIGQIMRWKEIVKKYAGVSKNLDPREMFILCVAAQRWPGPVLEIGTHKGITTFLLSEVQEALKRRDQLYTVELFKDGWESPAGADGGYPGDAYLKAIKAFRTQEVLSRVVAITGDSKKLRQLFWAIRPSVIFLDGDCTREGIAADLEMLKFFNHPYICLAHNANMRDVLEPMLLVRDEGEHRFANFHTGQQTEKGLIALTRL